MANIHIELKNGDNIVKAFKKSPEIMAKRLQEELLKLGVFTTGEVKEHITAGTDMWKPPILTGALRRGIQMRQTGKMKVIITSSDMTPYAQFVHEGTKFMRARPFFEITARKSKNKIEQFLQKGLDNAVKDIIKAIK